MFVKTLMLTPNNMYCQSRFVTQSFINETFRDYLNVFCFVYLNDVLIYNNIKKKHITHVRKVFNKLYIVSFYLNINKCEFYVNEIKYFEFIIIIDDVKMNSKKVQIIFDWKSFQNIKNVQTFLNFVNFYKKFIVHYFKLIQFLIVIIKINEKKFIFSWNFDNFEKKVFLLFKLTFIIASILQHFNFEKKNLNRIRCFRLNNNRDIVSKKRKRYVTISNFHVTKNVIDWMQLWNLREKVINYNKNF